MNGVEIRELTPHDIDTLCVNTLRMLAVDAVQKANSGHPGMPMGAAPMAYVLWTKFLKHDPSHPTWPDRDRFILSAGHGSMLLYSLLHLTGYDLSMDDLKAFRQWGSKTPGHPERGHAPGVEVTTGPLGQGLSNAVGMAIAEAHLAARYNRAGRMIVDHFTYVIASDGDLMEGVASEACSLAGHLGLGKLVVLYDDNRITIEGSTDLSFSEDVLARFKAYGWHVQRVEGGTDTAAIARAIRKAQKAVDKPSLIAVRTRIACGSPGKEGSAESHGAPLGEDEVRKTKANLGWPEGEHFFVPQEAKDLFRKAVGRGRRAERKWKAGFSLYAKEHPALADEFIRRMEGRLPDGWEKALPDLSREDLPTRAASGKAINVIAPVLPELVGGSADLAPSNNTFIKGEGEFSSQDRAGRNVHFGVREHGMGAVANGMALHGGVRPYVGTFLIFSDYMKPSIRLAALSGARVVYVFTHDSIGVGEDGPTHQPIEQMASLRSIPGLVDLRPADAAETAEAWRIAMEADGPVALALTRQKIKALDRAVLPPASSIARGAYVLADGGSEIKAIIIASGSEVTLALGAMETLKAKGIAMRVVNMASFALFERQDETYRRRVLPPGIKARVAVEAASPFGWERYVGDGGRIIGINRFGASAPGGTNFEKFGFTVPNIVKVVEDVLASHS